MQKLYLILFTSYLFADANSEPFKKYKIDLNDPNVKAIFQKRERIHQEYENSARLGAEIKETKNHKIKLVNFKKNFSLMEFQKEPIEHMIRVPNVANFSIPGAGKLSSTFTSPG